MLKRIIICTLMLALSFMMPLSASTQNGNALENKLSAVEIMIYGASFPGGILDRTDRLEEHIYGESYMGSIFQRIDVLYSHVKETTEFMPSLLTKINAIEWMVNTNITNAPIQPRISQMENTLGIPTDVMMSLDERIEDLRKVIFIDGEIEVIPAILTRDSLIKVRTTSPINSTRNKAGDPIEVIVDQDVFIGSVLIIPRGAKGTGTVTKVSPARNFGRDARLEISIDSINCIDGNTISTFIGDKATKETLSATKATGASVAGIAVLGPVGIIGGAFVSGKNIDIPAGTQLYVQTSTDEDLFGVTVRR